MDTAMGAAESSVVQSGCASLSLDVGWSRKELRVAASMNMNTMGLEPRSCMLGSMASCFFRLSLDDF